jgi:iron complex outermembrane receptor protein
MNIKKIIFLLSILLYAFTVYSADNLDQLLSEYSEKADLSNKTKIESSGSLIVFTRKDLDRMKVKSLNELIELIPFLRYNIDNYGYTNPFYTVFELNTSQLFKVYINDREVYTPLTKSSLTLISMLDLEYIDHIEVYLGMSSFSKETSSAITTIKMYTKDPKREATNVTGISTDNFNSKDFYIYSAHQLDSFSYLMSFNYRDINNKN